MSCDLRRLVSFCMPTGSIRSQRGESSSGIVFMLVVLCIGYDSVLGIHGWIQGVKGDRIEHQQKMKQRNRF